MDNKLLLAKNSLKANGFNVEIFNSAEEAKKALLEEIDVNESVAFGGSITLDGLGLYEELKNRGNEVYWHWKVEDKATERMKAITTDVYLTSTNALTLDGKLVNMDGAGNRVASMIFGHKRVYVIVGKNKICKDYEEASKRIKNVAAPKNAKRLNTNTPCRFTGSCNDCSSPDRLCNVEVILHRNPAGSNVNIFLIDEELGF
ncbi:MAG: lactate utilization protein [Tissierellales bacterium]